MSADIRAPALAEARAWLGTPYQHQASARGVGADCLGLVRGVWRALYGAEPEPMPAYRPDWAEACGRETLLQGARRWLTPVGVLDAQPGDVLLFRMADGAMVKHAAILSAAPTAADPYARILHAYWGRSVVESWLVPWWASRRVAAFAFPPGPPLRSGGGGREADGGGSGGRGAWATPLHPFGVPLPRHAGEDEQGKEPSWPR